MRPPIRSTISLDDGKAQTRAPSLRRVGALAPPEGFEDQRLVVRGIPGPSSLTSIRTSCADSRTLTRLWSAMADRVVEQIGDHFGQPDGMGTRKARKIRRIERKMAAAPAARSTSGSAASRTTDSTSMRSPTTPAPGRL